MAEAVEYSNKEQLEEKKIKADTTHHGVVTFDTMNTAADWSWSVTYLSDLA